MVPLNNALLIRYFQIRIQDIFLPLPLHNHYSKKALPNSIQSQQVNCLGSGILWENPINMNIISNYNKKEPQIAALLRLNMFQIVTE